MFDLNAAFQATQVRMSTALVKYRACKFMLVAKRREKHTSVQCEMTLSHPSAHLFFYTGQTDTQILTYFNTRHTLFIKHYA